MPNDIEHPQEDIDYNLLPILEEEVKLIERRALTQKIDEEIQHSQPQRPAVLEDVGEAQK